jgi:hypothetical protein
VKWNIGRWQLSEHGELEPDAEILQDRYARLPKLSRSRRLTRVAECISGFSKVLILSNKTSINVVRKLDEWNESQHHQPDSGFVDARQLGSLTGYK